MGVSRPHHGSLRLIRYPIWDFSNSLLEQIRQIPIQLGSGQFARLSDVAAVSRAIQQPPTDQAIVSGQPAVVLGVLMQSGLRIDRWSADVRDRLDAFRAQVPDGVSVDLIFDQSGYVDDRIGALIGNLVFGALLVVGVTLVAMGWRSALIVGAALPLSALMVFGWMTVFGVAIQQMSVTGLIIALGLLIDNAIVVVDEIQVEIREGARPADAVGKTVNYLAGPLLASTLTTVLTFLPIYLLPGPAGEFVGTISLSVILALISSFALSLTAIASLAGRMLARRQAGSGAGGRLQRFLTREGAWWNDGISLPQVARGYRRLLSAAVARPTVAIAATFVVPLIGFLSAPTLEEQFFPATARDQFQIELESSPQTAIAATRDRVLRARQVIRQHDLVEDVHWFLGESAPKFYYNFTSGRANQAQYAQAMVNLNAAEGAPQLMRDLQAELDAQFPESRFLVRELQQGPPYDAPIEFRIVGPDLDELRRLGIEARSILAQVPGITHVSDDLTAARPQLQLQVDEEQAQQIGSSNGQIASQLQAYLEGATGGSILESTEELPVRVRISDRDRADLSHIASLDLRPEQAGDRAFRPASALGDFALAPEFASIARRNEQRVNTVRGYLVAGELATVALADFQQALADSDFELPPGYRSEYGGEQAERSDAVGNLLAFVPLLVVLMVVALVLSLGSFRLAFLVGAVGIGAVGTALFALKVTGSLLGFMAIVGSMGLVGIAINDTVIVITALNADAFARAGDRRAIVKVVMASTRHVVTTTITTIAGFVPLLASGDPFWRPLAIAIACGISGSSVLALFFVPAVYRLLYRNRQRSQPATQKR